MVDMQKLHLAHLLTVIDTREVAYHIAREQLVVGSTRGSLDDAVGTVASLIHLLIVGIDDRHLIVFEKRYLLLQFLPAAFSRLPVVDFGWPGVDVTLFGETFKWNILGYDAAHGGLPYFCAYMIAMVIGECINFPIQRNFVFRSKGNLAKQIGWYVLAFCVITCIVNSINCVWVAVAGLLVPDFIYNIGTTVLNGGVSMVIFFFVNKIIFPESGK